MDLHLSRGGTETLEETLRSILLYDACEIGPTRWAQILGLPEARLHALCSGSERPEKRVLRAILKEVNSSRSQNNIYAQALRLQVAAHI